MEQETQRTGLGQFAPGASGNAGGRPRKTEEQREAERVFASKAVWAARKAIRMAENKRGRYSESIEWQATQHILDRHLGKVAPRESSQSLEGITFVVHTLQVEAKPVPGVLCSPIKEHIALPTVERAE